MVVVKDQVGDMINLGRYLTAGLFGLAALFTYVGIFQGKMNFTRLITCLVIGFVMLQSYTWIMDTTRDIVEGINYQINGGEDYLNEFLDMSTMVQQKHEEVVEKGLGSKIMDAVANFGKETMHNFVVSLSFMFFSLIVKIMTSIRNCVIGIMYLLGPLLIPFLLFDTTRKVVRGWFTSYIGCLAWPILWNLTVRLSIAYASTFSITDDSVPLEALEPFVALNFAVGFVVVFAPMIITSLANGIGAGAAASLAGAFASQSAMNVTKTGIGTAGRVMEGVSSGVSYGAGKALHAVQANPSNNIIRNVATVGGGALKNGVHAAWRGLRGKDIEGYKSAEYSIKKALRPAHNRTETISVGHS
ncbi:MAG: type IV secretion system protein [Candidatus Omnitrophica bacterium]|nr:type IV secretion system protein [Candidatus Omnitrophota bacterium]